MLLCDVGNSSFEFYDTYTFKSKKYFIKDMDFSNYITTKIFYINVNPKLQSRLNELTNWINIEDFIDKSSYYATMGLDRIVACEAIEDGLIIDAGSAITVDKLKNSEYEGGFIYPGIFAMQKCFKDISTNLDYPFNFELNLDKMAKNSQDAISYGFIAPIISEIKKQNCNTIYLTGGDAAILHHFLPNATIDTLLIFRGMQKIIENKKG